MRTSIKSNIRYTLVQKMMEENFSRWLAQPNTINLVTKLIEDCKKPNINMVGLNTLLQATPNPIFLTRQNPLSQSQTLNQHFSHMPPISPNSSALLAHHEKRNFLIESQIEDKQAPKDKVILNLMISLLSHRYYPRRVRRPRYHLSISLRKLLLMIFRKKKN
jgi:hypothetical protein